MRDTSLSGVEWHLEILQGLQTKSETLKLPRVDVTGLDILDVGCGVGQHLSLDEFAKARSRHGIDIDRKSIDVGSKKFPELNLQCAPAEAIPYPAASFDLTYSSVSVCYTRIPNALAEMFRVTRPGGMAWLSFHGAKMERLFIWNAIRGLKVKALIHHAYVVANGLYFSLTGDTFYRPGSDKMESFQTQGAMRRAMKRAGFVDIEFDEDGDKLIVQARRP